MITFFNFFYIVLGKNGEPKPKIEIDLKLQHKLIKKVISITLKTNEEGVVALGKLQDISCLKATVKENLDILT